MNISISILSLLLFSCILVYSQKAQTGLYDGCVFNMTDSRGITAEYDLEWFNLDNEVFEVLDSFRTQFKYFFNICGSIPARVFNDNKTIPDSCRNIGDDHGPCINFDESDPTNCNEHESTTGKFASAVQIDSDNNACMWLGMEVDTKDNLPEFNISLYDNDNAGRGVVYSILNGEWCPEGQKNRELKVSLICPDVNRIEFKPGDNANEIQTEEVDEFPTCTYNLVVESALACPNTCVSRLTLDMFSVCATHGICDDDLELGRVRCLCDNAWTGPICETQIDEIVVVEQNHPGLLAAIIICIILLGVAIVLAAVLCHKIRMKEAEERSGQMAVGLTADHDDDLEKKKQAAVSMQVGSGSGAITTNIQQTSAVRLETMDDQLVNDNNNDDDDTQKNELIDDDDNNNTLLDDGGQDKDEQL